MTSGTSALVIASVQIEAQLAAALVQLINVQQLATAPGGLACILLEMAVGAAYASDACSFGAVWMHSGAQFWVQSQVKFWVQFRVQFG